MMKLWARVWCLIFCHSVIATQPEKNRATAIGNKRKILVKIGHAVPEDMLTDRQTDRKIHKQIRPSQYFSP